MSNAISTTRCERRKLTDAQLYANEQRCDHGDSQLGADLDSEGRERWKCLLLERPTFRSLWSLWSLPHRWLHNAMWATRTSTGDFIAFGESAQSELLCCSITLHKIKQVTCHLINRQLHVCMLLWCVLLHSEGAAHRHCSQKNYHPGTCKNPFSLFPPSSVQEAGQRSVKLSCCRAICVIDSLLMLANFLQTVASTQLQIIRTQENVIIITAKYSSNEAPASAGVIFICPWL